jgi:hypothetical protein
MEDNMTISTAVRPAPRRHHNEVRIAGKPVYTTLAVQGKGVRSVLEAEILLYLRGASTINITV